jgi:glycogen debranching enzyme
MSSAERSGPSLADTNLGVRDPHVDVVHDGYTVLVTRVTGELGETSDQGLFDFDCRILSWWYLRVDGEAPGFVSALPVHDGRWGAVNRVKRSGGTDEGPALPQDGIEVIVTRRVGRGMEEQIRLTNHSMAPCTPDLELELGATFQDTVEAPTADHPQHGSLTASWDQAARAAELAFEDAEGDLTVRRVLRVTVTPPLEVPASAHRINALACVPDRAEPLAPGLRETALRLSLRVPLAARGSVELRLVYESLVDGEWRAPLPEESVAGQPESQTAHERWRADEAASGPAVRSANPSLDRTLAVAAADLRELRNWDLPGDADDSWLPNAGVPRFTGVFGRDSLLAGVQSLAFGRAPLAGALRWMADTQGRVHDLETEEQPGRMLHEHRRGPMSDLRRIPQHRFYGAHTTSSLFPWALAEHWLWTGDLEAVRRWLPPAHRALAWAARDGDRDGDGFLEYAGTARAGLKNQAWKDSGEAVRYPDGRQVDNPVATVEEQAFHLHALECLAGLALAVGEEAEAAEALGRARTLRTRWHEAYWMPADRWYALALDARKDQVRSVGSNPAHGLLAGSVPPECAPELVARLFTPDLDSGWGIRTLSSRHPSYNPLAYHLGSVWPFENAMFAAGLRAYGFDDEAEQLISGQLTGAAHFRESRLPELFGGHDRRALGVPTVYPDSNTTQAWTASAMASLLSTVLGLRPLAPVGRLALVRPRLPAWLPWLVVERLPVGEAKVSMRFERRPDGCTAHEVMALEGTLEVVRTDERPDASGPGSEVLPLIADVEPSVRRAIRTTLVGTRADG